MDHQVQWVLLVKMDLLGLDDLDLEAHLALLGPQDQHLHMVQVCVFWKEKEINELIINLCFFVRNRFVVLIIIQYPVIRCQYPRSSWSSWSTRISRSCQHGKVPDPTVTTGNKQISPPSPEAVTLML